MARAARTLAVATVPALVVAAVWLRCEHPRQEAWRAAALVALALAVAVVPPRPRAARGAVAVAACALAARIAFGLSPLDARPHDARHDFFGPVGSRFANGFLDFYDVRLPFDPHLHADMGAVVLVAIFAFSLALGLAVDARRPVAAALVLLAGAGWPATLLGPSHAVAAGVAILLGALVLLAGTSARRVPRAALPAALGLAALGAASAPALATSGVVPWQSWDPYTRPDRAVNVSFVWSSRYLGLRWPRKRTTVLEVAAPETSSLYWRAAVLDDFVSDGWRVGAPRGSDALEPPAAFQPRRQTEQTVTVEALADTRLVGGSVPIRFDAGGEPLAEQVPGFASLPAGLPRGFRYRVWSWAPQPTARELLHSRPAYPPQLRGDGFFDVWPGVRMPSFGSRGRASTARAVLESHPEASAYAPLARLAEEVGGRERTPYGAAVALESWFRSSGGFRYTNRVGPLFPNPLVGFVTSTRAGYCQYFAGAMALMLRYLGVPARVAVGFSSGTYDPGRGVWVVTDHDAHAWVEAWFSGYGWLPFDPTPSAGRPERGVLSAGYSASSPGFGLGGGAPGAPAGSTPAVQAGHRHGEQGTGVAAAARAPARGRAGTSHAFRTSALFVLLVLAAAGVGGLTATKLAVRAVQRLPRDPRRTAAACRRELAAYLVDQRIPTAASATLHELGELLRSELAVDPDRFVAAASAARFGRGDGAPAAAREARRELRALRRAIRTRLGARERLRGLLSLRSLGVAR